MSNLSDLLILTGTVFLGSYLLARALSAFRAKPRERLPILLDAKLKLLTSSGAYRCHVEEVGKDGIVVTSPLYRDAYVPLRIGESVVVQTPHDGALITFRTEITARDAQTHQLTLAMPSTFRRTDRRCEPRLKSVEGKAALINGTKAAMVDVSAWGARILTSEALTPGEMVRVELPSGIGEAMGWVLESIPVAMGARLTRAVRIRFEDPLSGLVSPKGWGTGLRTQ